MWWRHYTYAPLFPLPFLFTVLPPWFLFLPHPSFHLSVFPPLSFIHPPISLHSFLSVPPPIFCLDLCFLWTVSIFSFLFHFICFCFFFSPLYSLSSPLILFFLFPSPLHFYHIPLYIFSFSISSLSFFLTFQHPTLCLHF